MSYTFARPRFRTSTKVAKAPRHGTATVDLASIASDGSDATHTVTVTGAAVGDDVTVHSSLPVAGLIYEGYVSAADTVTIRISNPTGGAVDAPSATYHVVVWSPEA